MREEAGVSQAELARRAGMNRAQLCVVEKGRQVPKPETLSRLAAALGVCAAAFERNEASAELMAGYRPIRRASARLLSGMEKVVADDRRLDEMEDACGVVSATTLPLVHHYLLRPQSSAFLARSLRDSLGVGTAAFPDLVWTFEFANIRVRKGRLPAEQRSAAWWNAVRGALTIVLDEEASPERQRYRMAYELGAACLFRSHGNRSVVETVRERRFLAEFAADFLMPAAAVADVVSRAGVTPTTWTMSQLLAFKAHFGVSAEAFALRLEELGLIAKPLRQKFRSDLRARYKSHPTAMEPEPNLRAMVLGTRERILAERMKGRRP